jgi:hypothetical protein
MMTHGTTPGDVKKSGEAPRQRGFFGAAAVGLNVRDGTIKHIRRKAERIEK